MLRMNTFLRALLISLLIMLSANHTANVSVASRASTSHAPAGGSVITLAIDPLTPTVLYVGIAGGGVYKSTNGGENWSAANTGLPFS